MGIGAPLGRSALRQSLRQAAFLRFRVISRGSRASSLSDLFELFSFPDCRD